METTQMTARKKRDEKSAAIAQAILEAYKPTNREEMQEAIKDIFGPMFEAMLQGEMEAHLGYESNDHGEKDTDNRRNGYIHKTVNSTYGPIEVNVPRDRNASFEPEIIPKRSKDVSGIEDKVLSMYARGMSQRDIASTIEDIYGFEISHEKISQITDRVLETAREWQNRPLQRFYTFMFVDCLYVTIRQERESKNYAVYTILGYDINGYKDILGLWLSESESKHNWMQIFDELKGRGVEDVLFICMDGVSGLEEGARSIFKDAIVQRCIVHLIRNSLKYVPSKDYKKYTSDLKKVYGAINLEAAKSAFEAFEIEWSKYPGAVAVWQRNWQHVEQLFNYGSAVRRMIYTTNAVESVNSSFRKVTKQGAFPNEDALIKLLYLRVTELYRKWNDRPVPNWAMVRNQLANNEDIENRILKYDRV